MPSVLSSRKSKILATVTHAVVNEQQSGKEPSEGVSAAILTPTLSQAGLGGVIVSDAARKKAKSPRFPWADRPEAVQYVKEGVLRSKCCFSGKPMRLCFEEGVRKGLWSLDDKESVINKWKNMCLYEKTNLQ